ncbi:MAG TPA: hypothetical protein VNN79_08000 [Actinomycetota bacterium]|nr:hypothetical protein [Actinomycetota bacterium]
MPKIAQAAEAKAKREADERRIGATHTLPERKLLVAVDPGDEHVGIAAFIQEVDEKPVCAWTTETDPVAAADQIARMITRDEVAVLVVERYSLYADKALAQIGSEMHTSELIGVLKYLVRVHNLKVWAGDPKDPWATGPKQRIELAIQGASIKRGTRAQLEARGIVRVGQVKSHSGDAEEHGWHFLLRNGESG